MILVYVGWLLTVRKVSSATISQYISGLRVAHLKNGVLPQNLRPDILKMILKGQEHVDKENKIPRLAMTIPVMKLLKKLITLSNMTLDKKRLLWAISCISFHGSFRIHELLSRDETKFDATTTLLGKDVRLIEVEIDGEMEEILTIHLKNPKEDNLHLGVTVELFATKTFSWPVAAFKKWRNVTKAKPTLTKPIFCQGNGNCMTGALFNRSIKSLLGKYIDYDQGKYLSHSFRAGIASMMAAAGYPDTEIMRQGRWHSQAFKKYCKTGRSTRLVEQRELARKLTNM